MHFNNNKAALCKYKNQTQARVPYKRCFGNISKIVEKYLGKNSVFSKTNFRNICFPEQLSVAASIARKDLS